MKKQTVHKLNKLVGLIVERKLSKGRLTEAIVTEGDMLKGEVDNLYDTNLGYSGNVYDIATATRNNIIYPSMDPIIFEIRFKTRDIKGRVIDL